MVWSYLLDLEGFDLRDSHLISALGVESLEDRTFETAWIIDVTINTF